MQHTFLVELGTEELPPKALLGLSQAFAAAMASAFETAGVTPASLTPYATARRLALWVTGLPSHTPVTTLTHWGPPAKVGLDANGQLTKAGLAFAEKLGLNASQITLASDGKLEKLTASTQAGGLAVASLLAGFVSQALAALPIAKRMRWGSSRNEFVRPAQWLVMLLDNQVLPAQLLGLTSDRLTYGHRVHCPQPLAITQAEHYAQQLASQGYVMADFAQRRAYVRAQVEAQGAALGGSAVIDADLLDEVTALVEWPVALAGQFEERFLQVPAEALISSMKEHQKYFHVVNADGQLMPHFITVANLESLDPAAVIAGNEKVIRPRLSDAAFFFHSDLQTPLPQLREKLRSVTFQAQLGSLFDKTERLAQLSGQMAQALGEDVAQAQRAGQLSKADLVSKLVYEFADLQGIAGRYYAQQGGEAPAVADALQQHYSPKFAGDALPESPLGALLALADRLDTLVGIFGIGQVPTGSKDPFALRRASVGALRILIEKGYPLCLRQLLTQAASLYGPLPVSTIEPALQYMLERLSSHYSEAGISAEVFQSVQAKGLTEPLDIHHRVEAVAAFSQMPQAPALAAANKRVANILAKLPAAPASSINAPLLQHPAEQHLAQALNQQQQAVAPLLAARNYRQALASLAELRPSLDAFFDDVMVMCEDEALRNNRLALLQQLRALFLEVADISCLVVK